MSDSDDITKLRNTLRQREIETRLPGGVTLTDGEMLFAGALRRVLREMHGLPDASAWEIAIVACRSLKQMGRLTGANVKKVAEMTVNTLKREGRMPT